jgi:ceramide glucosyltransferase
MMVWSSAQLPLVIAGAVVLTYVVLWHRALSRAGGVACVPSHPRARYPSVSVVRPMRGVDIGAEENIAAALDMGYPGELETLFVVDEEDAPETRLARSVLLRHPKANARILVATAPPPGITGKLNAMIHGVRHARGELIGFQDSDTRPDREVLRGVVDALLNNERAGAAFAPVVVSDAPQAAGDVFYALMLNALYTPLATRAAGSRRTLPFIMGQLMVFRRAALEAIGGLASVGGQLVDDMALGARLHQAGFENVMSRPVLRIVTGGMSARDYLPVFRRWLMFSRNGLPSGFTWPQWLHGASFFVALGLLAVSLAHGWLPAALVATAAVLAPIFGLRSLHARYGGAPLPLRWIWVPAALFLLVPILLAVNELTRQVSWRGRDYRVDSDAAIFCETAASDAIAAAGRR